MGNLKSRVDAVKDRVDIRSVVGEWVSLSAEKGGKSVGLCPFHGDHHPSLSVNSNKKIFKCFSCGEGGNVRLLPWVRLRRHLGKTVRLRRHYLQY